MNITSILNSNIADGIFPLFYLELPQLTFISFYNHSFRAGKSAQAEALSVYQM